MYRYIHIQYLHKIATQSRVPDGWVNYFTIAEWAQQNTEPQAVVACRKPILFYLYSDRRTVLYKFTDDSALLLEELKQNKVNYVVLDRLGYGSTGRYLVPAVTKYVDDFFLVRKLENPPTWLLEFHPSD